MCQGKGILQKYKLIHIPKGEEQFVKFTLVHFHLNNQGKFLVSKKRATYSYIICVWNSPYCTHSKQRSLNNSNYYSYVSYANYKLHTGIFTLETQEATSKRFAVTVEKAATQSQFYAFMVKNYYAVMMNKAEMLTKMVLCKCRSRIAIQQKY